MNSTQVAHFFWHGELSLYEYQCINSFVRHGFDVRVWTYTELDIPPGSIQCDASGILPMTELTSFKVLNPKTKQYEERGGINSGFSDLFRFNVLLKHGGWWFDTDVVCLRHESEFEKLLKDKHIVAGKEDETYTNGAVLSLPSKSTNEKLLDKCVKLCEQSREFSWGAVGPKLITNFVKEEELEHEVYNRFIFYPLNYNEVNYFFNPSLKARAIEVSKGAYTTHLWNWILTDKLNINKQIPPPEGSYLHSIFNL